MITKTVRVVLTSMDFHAASVPATLANGAHGGAGATLTLQTPVEATLEAVLGTALTEGAAGRLAAAIKEFFDKEIP
jgi:hypothetical protein